MKYLPLIAMSLLTLTATSQADEIMPTFTLSTDASASVTKKKDLTSVYTLNVDLLYWDSILDNTTFVMQDFNPNPAPNDVVRSKYRSVKTDFEAGVRLGAQVLIPRHDFWDIGIFWTHHEASRHGSNVMSQSSGPDPFTNRAVCFPKIVTLDALISSDFDQNAPAEQSIYADKFRTDNNWIDVEIGRMLQPFDSSHLYTRPHFGLRYVSVDHSFTTSQTLLGTSVQNNQSLQASAICKNRSEYDGLGLRFGIDTQWAVNNYGLSLFAKIAWSYIYGEFDVKLSEELGRIINIDPDPTGTKIVLRDEWHSGKSIVDLFIGMMLETTVHKGRVGITVRGGWEHHKLYGQNQYMRLMDASGCKVQNHGDLLLRGLTLGAQFDF